MKPSRFQSTIYLASLVFLLAACGSAGDEADKTTDSTTTSTSSTDAAPASTIVTTPQVMMVVTHKVKDFDKWLPVFEAHDSMKLANGLHNYIVGRATDDPNMIFVATKADDANKAKAFSKDASLKKAMQESGVVGNPSISITNVVFQDTAQVNSDLRVRTNITVKDWDAWKRSFDSTRQVATDNGLAIRAYGHDIDNNKQVVIVSAILDSAKASAYWNSDLLKQRRAASGAGEPKRFVYRVVKRY